MAADGIEAARRCCGGHGYSSLSGLPELLGDYNAQVAYEGDNNVLSLQATQRAHPTRALAVRTLPCDSCVRTLPCDSCVGAPPC